MPAGTIWLLPATLGGTDVAAVIPEAVLDRVRKLEYFLVEEPKSARAFLKLAGHPGPLARLRIERLTNDTPALELAAMIDVVRDGVDAGLLSEAGCSAVADPGATLVRLAHQAQLRVVPLTGPSSPILALMASGLETQRFSFHGYLPIKEPARTRAIRAFEQQSLPCAYYDVVSYLQMYCNQSDLECSPCCLYWSQNLNRCISWMAFYLPY